MWMWMIGGGGGVFRGGCRRGRGCCSARKKIEKRCATMMLEMAG